MGRIGLDPSKSVGTAFELEGYPTLVILDGKGIVQSVHVGFNPEAAEPLSKTLAKEIDTLLEGKSLDKPQRPGQGFVEKIRQGQAVIADLRSLRYEPWGVQSTKRDAEMFASLFSAAELFDVTHRDQAGAQVFVEMGFAANADSLREQRIDVKARRDVEIRNR